MNRVVAFDITRLFLGPLSLAPRGIDRVDLVLANHFFDDADSPHLGILPTPWGMRAFTARQVKDGLKHLSMLWAEETAPADDHALQSVIDRLCSRPCAPEDTAPPKRVARDKAMRFLRQLQATGLSRGLAVRKTLPAHAVYLNIGQIGLAVPFFHYWLHARQDVSAVFMIHDVIPLHYPDMVEPASVAHHGRMIRTAARHAHAVIATTDYACTTVRQALADNGRTDVSTFVRSLPLPEPFRRASSAPEELTGVRYFIVCSTVEPRKNHRLLFDVWQRLKEYSNGDIPHLVIVGSKGWEADRILDKIEERGLTGLVHHVAGLSTPSLIRLLLGSAALLSPSLAEGFGLPVLEAGALGVPVLASDIPAHREIANPATVLLPADNAELWVQAIHRQPVPHALRRSPSMPCETSSTAYCRDIEKFLEKLARDRSISAQ